VVLVKGLVEGIPMWKGVFFLTQWPWQSGTKELLPRGRISGVRRCHHQGGEELRSCSVAAHIHGVCSSAGNMIPARSQGSEWTDDFRRGEHQSLSKDRNNRK
jgi:hypothetical protein